MAKKPSDDRQDRRELAKKHGDLITALANKYNIQGCSIKDLTPLAAMALIRASWTYDPERDKRFEAYATRVIEKELAQYICSLFRQRCAEREAAAAAPASTEAEGGKPKSKGGKCKSTPDKGGKDKSTLDKGAQSKEAPDKGAPNKPPKSGKSGRELSERQKMYKALKTLDEFDQRMLEQLYGLNDQPRLAQSRVAEQLGLSQQTMARFEKRMVGRLKAAMKRIENEEGDG